MIRAVFFDFDGVMTRDRNDIITTCRYIAGRIGLPQEGQLYRLYEASVTNMWDFYGGKITEEELWQTFYQKVSLAGLTRMPYTEFQSLRAEAFKATHLDPNIVGLVRKTRSSGYKTALITDNCAERMSSISQEYDMNGFFDAIISSAELKITKREPGMFMAALQMCQVDAPESIYIDNNPDNLRIPRGLGFHVFHFDDLIRNYSALADYLNKECIRLL